MSTLVSTGVGIILKEILTQSQIDTMKNKLLCLFNSKNNLIFASNQKGTISKLFNKFTLLSFFFASVGFGVYYYYYHRRNYKKKKDKNESHRFFERLNGLISKS
ncbi:hypothetical protein FG386_001404 [Cryptosporidium ryanae]|uniref:uncharacterized protein n=1 Tax=Cryptosporidium ryanae TaxID=515981 RepID=UPI003519E014|nr:hypothetical protein FG386_001404 [Cryptosporidium ryanae]